MSRHVWVGTLIAACVACATAATASPIAYDFTVTAVDGPLAGTLAQGDFTFDSSSITPGAVNGATGLFTSLHFTWNGVVYTEATANTGALVFDASGELINALFGTMCMPGSCSGLGGFEGWTVGGPPGFPGFFAYTPASADIGFGGISMITLATVPEPAVVLLVATALALGALTRRASGNA